SNELKERIKKIIKQNKERIIKGIILGKFDEGIGVFISGKHVILKGVKEIIFAHGGRYIPPLFANNDLPGIISRRLYLSHFSHAEKAIIMGSTDEAIRTAYVGKRKVLYREGASLFTKIGLELAEKEGIELIPVRKVYVKRKGNKLIVKYDANSEEVDILVFDIVKQPKLEITYNLGINYKFYKKMHIYSPTHNILGEFEQFKIVGGSRGIYDDELSFLSSKAALGIYVDDFISKLKETPLYGFYNNDYSEIPSPYIFDDTGYFCECEDITADDIIPKLKKGYTDVESIKRVTGACTGKCQGKLCAYLIGSYLKSERLITFRSPIYSIV
ncbi:(2Fe-2S)-binding protein, partial [Acidianus sp. RZ1]